MARIPFFKNITMNNGEILLNIKMELDHIKENNQPNSPSNKSKLNAFLAEVSSILNKKDANLNHRLAAWLLMADIYGFLSYLWSSSSLSKAERCLNESIKCVEHVQQISDALSPEQRPDSQFIKSCNTLNIADANEAMSLIKENLLPHLKTLSEEQDLFTPVVTLKIR